MRNLFRTAAFVSFAALVIAPALSRLAGDAAERMTGAVSSPVLAWLAQIGVSAWYFPATCFLGGLALGAFLDWLLGAAEGRRQAHWSTLASELDANKDAIVAVLRLHNDTGILDRGRAFQVLTDMASLELVLKRYGIKSPTERWTQSMVKEMDLEKLAELVGYIGLLTPLLRRGQMKEARRVGMVAAKDSSRLLAIGTRTFMTG